MFEVKIDSPFIEHYSIAVVSNITYVAMTVDDNYFLDTFNILIFTTLLAYSANDKLVRFFLIFPRKQDLTFHANWTIYMKYQILFFGKNKKIYFNMSSAEYFTQSAKR